MKGIGRVARDSEDLHILKLIEPEIAKAKVETKAEMKSELKEGFFNFLLKYGGWSMFAGGGGTAVIAKIIKNGKRKANGNNSAA